MREASSHIITAFTDRFWGLMQDNKTILYAGTGAATLAGLVYQYAMGPTANWKWLIGLPVIWGVASSLVLLMILAGRDAIKDRQKVWDDWTPTIPESPKPTPPSRIPVFVVAGIMVILTAAVSAGVTWFAPRKVVMAEQESKTAQIPAPPLQQPRDIPITPAEHDRPKVSATPKKERTRQATKNVDPKPQDRSVHIGDKATLTNSPVITGDNAKVDIHTGPPEPPDPFVLTEKQQQDMEKELSGLEGQELALVCIGRGCESLPSVQPVFKTWRLSTTGIGQLGSFGGVNLSLGVHVLGDASPARRAIEKALISVDIKYAKAPTQSPCDKPLCLVIGNPQ